MGEPGEHHMDMRILVALQWQWPAGMDSGDAYIDSWFVLWFTGPGAWARIDGERVELPAHLALLVPPGHRIARGTLLANTTRFAHFHLGAHWDRARCGPLVVDCRGDHAGDRDAVFACDRLPVSPHGPLHLLRFLATALQRVPQQAWPDPDWDHRLQRVLAAIDQAPAHPWRNAELAELFGAGEAHFRRRFVACLGTSPRHYLQSRRLAGVARELIHTAAPIDELAERWGFADRNHLSTAFARHYGCGPAAWRRQGAR